MLAVPPLRCAETVCEALEEVVPVVLGESPGEVEAEVVAEGEKVPCRPPPSCAGVALEQAVVVEVVVAEAVSASDSVCVALWV